MTDIVKTSISISEINTPKINANELNVKSFGVLNSTSINTESGYIKNLTVDSITVNTGENEGNEIGNETYENSIFGDITLNFDDAYNGKYLVANPSSLISEETVKILEVKFNVPEELGSRLTCRYLVVDLREEALGTDIIPIYPDDTNTNWKLKWLYDAPELEAGYFYVLAFQRLAKNLIVGNVAVKVEM